MTIVGSFTSVRRALRQGNKSPHKPLLLLTVLMKYRSNETRWLNFERDISPILIDLLKIAGISSQRPEYPFWRMQKDGIWVVRTDSVITKNSSGDVSKRELIRLNASGALTQTLYDKYMENVDDYSSISLALIAKMLDLSPEKEALIRDILEIEETSSSDANQSLGVEIECLLEEMMGF